MRGHFLDKVDLRGQFSLKILDFIAIDGVEKPNHSFHKHKWQCLNESNLQKKLTY